MCFSVLAVLCEFLCSYLLFIRFCCCYLFFFFKQKTAYEMRISDWSSDVCSSDLDLLGELIARAEVDLQLRVLEGRLGAERAGILILPELAQIFLTVIDRDVCLEADLVVEGDEVGRIGEAGHREAAGRDVIRIYRIVGLVGGAVERKSCSLNT